MVEIVSTDTKAYNQVNSLGKMPVVSVCVITYNQEKYIRQCLQSIVDQVTDFDYDIIVGEDCSTDGTRAIVKEFEERYPEVVKPIYQSKNIGGGNYNFLTVHNAAKGEYIAHVDGDDYFLPNKLQVQKRFLEMNPEFSLVWHRAKIVDSNDTCLTESKNLRAVYDDGVVTIDKLLRYGMAGFHSSLMYRRSARKTISPYFETLDLFYSLEYLCVGKGMLLDEVLGAYRLMPNTLNSIKNLKVRQLAAHHVGYFYEKYPRLRKDVFLYALTNMLIDLKHRRSTYQDFSHLARRSFCWISPQELLNHLKCLENFRDM